MRAEEIRAAVLASHETIAPNLDTGGIRTDRPLRVQLDLDSMDWLNVIAGLHERLGVDIPEADYGRLTSLDEIVAYLGARLAQARHE
ncbi:acyl carrier protein [Aromatoleum bremense]|uniref:Acyl carrier protein n=1 Tax=Aromatoleum bremense TaxID=76115 RepID=A0ABX1NTS0_9RHOO|nr:acyl carrier protein [Aromatoleum bremense]NMG15414.1 acyl carrier protein [Aromatoleum bremense]QTQ34049.1 Acyl carrier protein [Aromatoleum bremense]